MPRTRPLLLALALLGTACPQPPVDPPLGDTGVEAGRDAATCATPCGSACCRAGQTCDQGACVDVCVPDCDGRSCGDDSCGALCGTCGPGTQCANGRCVACQPNCLGKQCGPDGCGSLCGVCGTGLACSESGTCAVCQPSCGGKQCGADGCGGVCGTCASGSACGADGLCHPEVTGCSGNPDCASTPATPVCDPTTRKCVVCTAASGCVAPQTCDPSVSGGRCVSACAASTDCAATPATPVCNLATKKCVVCTTAEGCPSPQTCDTSTAQGRCSADCTTSAQCAETPATPVCDTASHKCVTCTATTGCATGACDLSVAGGRCVECVDNTRCSGATPFCDLAQKKCVVCTGVSTGCSAGVCDQGRCVECTTNAHCPGVAPVCDVAANRCVTCVVGAGCGAQQVCDLSVPGGRCVGCLTSGNCSGATPVCNLTSHTCVICTGSEGCKSDGRVCDTSVASGRCVDCLGTVNCAAGRLCDLATKTCVLCTATQGCTAPRTCDTTVVGGVCQGCVSDPDCASSPSTPVCDASARCVTCTATKGCTAPKTCDTTVVGGTCVGCASNADCAAPAPACDPSLARCVACTASFGCSGATPRCKTGASPICVACLSTADCGAGLTCNPATNTCILPADVSQQIAAARASLDGTGLALPINGATVTYVRAVTGNETSGFFIQGAAAGPALLVEDPANTSGTTAGDKVSFVITQMGSPRGGALPGTRTALAVSGYTRDSTGNPVAALLQDLTSVAGVVSAPLAYESEYVSIRGVLGAAGAGGTGFVKFPLTTPGSPTAPQPYLRAPQGVVSSLDLAMGCTVNLKAGILDVYRGATETQAQPTGYRAADFTVVSCPAPRVVPPAVTPTETRVVVRFDRSLKASTVLPAAFSIPGLPVSSAVLGSDLKQVQLTTSAQTPGQLYLLTVAASVTDLLGVGVSPSGNSVQFLGRSTGSLGPLNGGFESWNAPPTLPSSWTAAAGVGVEQEVTLAHAGAFSVKLTRNSVDNPNTEFSATAIPVQEGTAYRVGMWFYDTDLNGKANVAYAWHDAANALIGTPVFSPTQTVDQAAWQELTLTTTPAPLNATSLRVFTRVYMQTGGTPTGGFVHLDDVTIESLSSTGTGLPPNGDLEGWSSPTLLTYWSAGSGVLVAQETNITHGGSYSAKLTRNSTTNSTVELSTPVLAVQEATGYLVSAWFFDGDPNGRANLGYAWYDAGGALVGSAVYGSTYTADSASWQEVTVSTGLPPVGATALRAFTRVYGQTGGTPTGGFVYLDDVTFNAQ